MILLNKVSEKSKHIISFLIPAILVLSLWLQTLLNDSWFRVRSDATRHFIWIQEMIKDHYISQSYLPGLHLTISQTSIISGLDVKLVYYSMSLLLIFVFIIIARIILKNYMNMPREALVFPYLAVLLFPVPYTVPFNTLCYFLFPLVILVILRYLEYQKMVDLIILFLLSFITAWFHYFSIVFLIFIVTAVLLSLISNSLKAKIMWRLWVVFSLSWILGFLSYAILSPTTHQTFNAAFSRYFVGLIPPEMAKYYLIIGLTMYGLFTFLLYLIIDKDLINKIYNNTKRNLARKFFNFIIVATALFVLIQFLYRLMFMVSANIFEFFEPPIPYVFLNALEITLEKAVPVTASFSSDIGALVFCFLSLILLKNRHEKLIRQNSKYVFLIAFIVPVIILFLIALALPFTYGVYASTLKKSIVYVSLQRFLTVIILPSLLLGSIFLSRGSNISKRILYIILVIGLLVVATNALGSEEAPLANKESTDWLEENAIPHLSFGDRWGEYYYISNLQKSYRFNVLDLFSLNIRITDNGNSYSPVLKISFLEKSKTLDPNVNYKPRYVENKFDYKIYENDIVEYYKR